MTTRAVLITGDIGDNAGCVDTGVLAKLLEEENPRPLVLLVRRAQENLQIEEDRIYATWLLNLSSGCC
ncbi:hypothetical protein CVT26_006870 [Gymnopilus dilepis]|uniref:Uncharacterized protein n=1 Tax=Gymnopilus dilepis TaxID=231916 RepID=A0A409W0U3_9AGAR|nr:hypothetical protein CVT26_006870 [Gymnopilus dilepis]